MLSLSPPTTTSDVSSSNNTQASGRRRGLSYLRNLSTHPSSSVQPPKSTEQTRISPRSLFARSTSYQGSKSQRASEPRRSRSHNRPSAGQSAARSPAESPTSQVHLGRPVGVGAGSSSEVLANEVGEENMTRTDGRSRRHADQTESLTRTVSAGDALDKKGQPTIRLYPHQDNNRLGRQSLEFTPVSRTLPSEASIIRVGRYSEREGPPIANPPTASEAPVGFKSKVVSRKHCEFLFVDGQWQIRDVASSSGTFLNHIRLSQPNQESRLYPIKDGDIVQLGIDFRGGEEAIFRCVKIRIECNRSWQKKPNNFNKQRQAQLRGLAKDQPSANANSGECSICLGNVLPCQALFVAPCAHVWHYKCIRPLLEGRQSTYPQFQCPNCRAYTDLNADVDVDPNDWKDEAEDSLHDSDHNGSADVATNDVYNETLQMDTDDLVEDIPIENTTNTLAPVGTAGSSFPVPQSSQDASMPGSLLSRRQQNTSIAANGRESMTTAGIVLPPPPTQADMQTHLDNQRTQLETTNTDPIMTGENPMTPRNNAGPFVFDGSGSRNNRGVGRGFASLDDAADDID